MSTQRLQVLFEDDELAAIREVATAKRQTVAAWVRDTLRGAVARESGSDPRRKLEALHRASEYAFPAPPIEQMVAEIEAGYSTGGGE